MQTPDIGQGVRLKDDPGGLEGRVVSRFDDDEGVWILVEWADATHRAYLAQDLERVPS